MERSHLTILFVAVLNLIVLSLQLVSITFVFLIGWWLLSALSRRKNKVPKSNWRPAVLTLLLLSSYWYITYSQKIVANVLRHGNLRADLASKIKPSHELAQGTTATELTNAEYQELIALTKFPALPSSSTNIQYRYDYDGFLPDYTLTLSYDLPADCKVDTFHRDTEKTTLSQTVEIQGQWKHVVYVEGRN